MKIKSDQYLRYVEWCDEDQIYIGRCPDLADGGVHAPTRIECDAKLQEMIEDVAEDYETEGNWPELNYTVSKRDELYEFIKHQYFHSSFTSPELDSSTARWRDILLSLEPSHVDSQIPEGFWRLTDKLPLKHSPPTKILFSGTPAPLMTVPTENQKNKTTKLRERLNKHVYSTKDGWAIEDPKHSERSRL